ncbi:RcnB family protein [Ensifer soli]|uniref:RcnB family protein n=1 Tax=Ciceribacter sp. sgz301302 TaxID=3342379 RepID=UPI0035BB8B6C
MKRLFLTLVASSFLFAPVSYAGPGGASYQVAQHREGHVERRVEKTVTRHKVVKRHHWTKGHRLSREERRRIVAVNDYRRHKLRAPPRGQQWVRIDNQFLLISVANGVIAGFVAAR